MASCESASRLDALATTTRCPPRDQHRVRYFGWLHPSATARRAVVQTLLAVVIVVRPAAALPPWHLRCPHCHAFALVVCGVLARGARAPP